MASSILINVVSSDRLCGWKPVVCVFVPILTLSIYVLYKWALPRPYPNIPHNKHATRSLLGDIPGLLEHGTRTGQAFQHWIREQVTHHNSPLIQIFIRPFEKPVLVLSDFRESQDILIRRKEFDRAPTTSDIFRTIAPDHHISLPTNGVWKAHRKLLQDLMSPNFLHGVAGPSVYANAINLVKLLELKSDIANGRPFSAIDDVFHAALDAVLGFAFGENFEYNATGPKLKTLEIMREGAKGQLRGRAESKDEPILFPQAELDAGIAATLKLDATMEEIIGKPLPSWRWSWMRATQPELRHAVESKNDYIRRELSHAVERMGDSDLSVRSAVDCMVRREKILAENEGRDPDYISNVMSDEVRHPRRVDWLSSPQIVV
jgi:hypothetical protein